MIPVLIVGGGAAGTLLHPELARWEVQVRSMDRLPKPASVQHADGGPADRLHLVRPDGYVGCRAPARNARSITDQLQGWIVSGR